MFSNGWDDFASVINTPNSLSPAHESMRAWAQTILDNLKALDRRDDYQEGVIAAAQYYLANGKIGKNSS